MTALATTGRDLARALSSIAETFNAVSAEASAEVYDRMIQVGANNAVAHPWMIARIVWRSSHWPPLNGANHVETLAECCRLLRSETERGRVGHWTHDFNRQIALEQAEAALVQLIVEDGE